MRKKNYRFTDNSQNFVTGNSQHSLKQNSGTVLGLQSNLVPIRSMLNDLLIAEVGARGKTVLL